MCVCVFVITQNVNTISILHRLHFLKHVHHTRDDGDDGPGGPRQYVAPDEEGENERLGRREDSIRLPLCPHLAIKPVRETWRRSESEVVLHRQGEPGEV